MTRCEYISERASNWKSVACLLVEMKIVWRSFCVLLILSALSLIAVATWRDRCICQFWWVFGKVSDVNIFDSLQKQSLAGCFNFEAVEIITCSQPFPCAHGQRKKSVPPPHSSLWKLEKKYWPQPLPTPPFSLQATTLASHNGHHGNNTSPESVRESLEHPPFSVQLINCPHGEIFSSAAETLTPEWELTASRCQATRRSPLQLWAKRWHLKKSNMCHSDPVEVRQIFFLFNRLWALEQSPPTLVFSKQLFRLQKGNWSETGLEGGITLQQRRLQWFCQLGMRDGSCNQTQSLTLVPNIVIQISWLLKHLAANMTVNNCSQS